MIARTAARAATQARAFSSTAAMVRARARETRSLDRLRLCYATLIFLSSSSFSFSPAQNYKVAVLGAAGGIGQPLSLLLKDNEHITHLSLYDIVNTPGVAADLSHIPTKAKVRVVVVVAAEGLSAPLSFFPSLLSPKFFRALSPSPAPSTVRL